VKRTGCVLLLGLALLLPAHADESARDEAALATWRATQGDAVRLFEQALQQEGLAAVLPLHQLLRSASDWKRCEAPPFLLPPEPLWPAVWSTLRLLAELQRRGLLVAVEVHSGHRDATLNACAGGAAGSAHLRSFALDLTPRDGGDPTPALCRFWRDEGSEWRMGFSRYSSGRLHIDTLRWRTWGPACA
jgi:hypothetical protein